MLLSLVSWLSFTNTMVVQMVSFPSVSSLRMGCVQKSRKRLVTRRSVFLRIWWIVVGFMRRTTMLIIVLLMRRGARINNAARNRMMLVKGSKESLMVIRLVGEMRLLGLYASNVVDLVIRAMLVLLM